MHETTDNDRANAVAKIPSGVAVLTAADAGTSTGMLASWMQQAAFEPLMVTVCVKAGRPIETLVAASRSFVLNVLGENPTDMFKHFGHYDPIKALRHVSKIICRIALANLKT